MNVHTFEIYVNISPEETRACRNAFYLSAAGQNHYCYKNKTTGILYYNRWSEHGVQVSIQKHTNGYCRKMLLRVNPSRLLGNMEATAIFAPTSSNMEALVQALDAIVQEMPISQTIHDFKLNRLDLCKNTPVNNTVLLEYIRLLEKGASCTGWKPDTYPDHRASHSFRRANDRYQVTVYDKLYQITDQLLSTSWDNPFSLLRLEASLFSQGIDQQLQQFSLDRYRPWYLLMDALCCHGEEIMLRLFQRLVPDAPYYTLTKAKERILWDTDFSSSKKWKLIEFLEKINRYAKVDTNSILQFKNGKKRLKQLRSIGINPVTIEARAGISYLPSLPQLVSIGFVPPADDPAE